MIPLTRRNFLQGLGLLALVGADVSAQVAVNYRVPRREYVRARRVGWTVYVEKQLIDEQAPLAQEALVRLESELAWVVKKLPPLTLGDLRRVNLFLLYGPRARGGGRASGLEYFNMRAVTHRSWLDSRMGRSIVIYDAENWVGISDLWARKALLHELGHAHQLEHWPERQEDIYAAWQQAMQGGLYQQVRPDDRDSHEPNYAARNQLEYFAELTATYFGGNSYFPYNRQQLKIYDPTGYALVRKMWKVRP